MGMKVEGAMFKRIVFSLVALFLICSTSANAKGPFNEFTIGGWVGGAYTNDATGQFSHCVAAANYVSGITFAVSVDVSGVWFLGFMHPSWQLTQGETIPIDLVFDGKSKFHVFGTVVDPNFVKVPMPVESSLIKNFLWARAMTAFAKGQLFGFNLTNTSKLLPALSNCTVANSGKGDTTWQPPADTNVSSLNPSTQ
jgi:hypothetical protein